MTTLLSRMQKLTFDEVGQAVSSVSKLGQEKDLENRRLSPSEVQKVIRFITAVRNGQISRLLPKDAVTLLRLTPALVEAKSSFTVHNAIRTAAPVVKALYERAPEQSPEKVFYRSVMVTAARACFDRRLSATGENRRLDEFELFRPFVDRMPEYRNALAQYSVHHSIGLTNRSLISENTR